MSFSKNFSLFMAANQSNQTLFKMNTNETNLNSTSVEIEKNLLWYTTTVLLILITILTILGNSMVLAATWLERSLHETNKYFIACLAVADLLVGIFSTPLRLYGNLKKGRITSIHLCRFYIWIDVFAESASIDTLTFISFDRYLKISKPLQYNLIMTTSKSFIVIFMVWLISISCATFGMFPYAGSPGIHIIPHIGCINNNTVFYTFSAIFAFVVPTFITLVMYVRIFFVAHKRRKKARNGELGQTYQGRSQRATFYQDLKNIRMLAFVMGAFIVCWGPFFTRSMFIYHHPRSNDFVFIHSTVETIIIVILPAFNSVCNPIIYAFFDEKYKKAFKCLYKRIIGRSTSEVIQSSQALGIERR